MKRFSFFTTKFLTIAGVSILSAGAQAADLVQLTCTNKGSFASLSQCQDSFDTLAANINTNLSDLPPGFDDGTYAGGVANSNAMASAGTGVVYGSSFKYGLIGGGFGLGVDLGAGNSLSDIISGNIDTDALAGFAAQGSAILGFNPGAVTKATWFGLIDPTRLRLYLSFMSMDRSFDTASVSFSNFGIVGQYRLIPEKSLGLNVVKWGGVDVTSGLKYSKMKIGFSQDVNQTTGAGATQVTLDAPLTFYADSSNFSIPIEASTSVRLLYVLNFVGGLGADINFGSTGLGVNLDGDISGGSGAEGTVVGNIGADASPKIMNLRGFVGAQFEFAIGSIYANIQKSLTAGVWGANLGVNFFY